MCHMQKTTATDGMKAFHVIWVMGPETFWLSATCFNLAQVNMITAQLLIHNYFMTSVK